MEKPLRILFLSDAPDQSEWVRLLLEQEGVLSRLEVAPSLSDYSKPLSPEKFDVALCMNGHFGEVESSFLEAAREAGIPFVLLADRVDDRAIGILRGSEGADYVLKSQLWKLAPTVLRLSTGVRPAGWGLERLVAAIQELSLAKDLPSIIAIARRAAREITGADGATFVLRDGDLCHYADEDAIGPLWKGLRFPMSACISGWSMLNRQPAVIEDIYADPRIPADAYRPTFVKSLVMVPIRTLSPVGAIGNYWAERRKASPEEVRWLQALADSTSLAMESMTLNQELEQRVKDRTAELETANRDLESFSFTVSHDLRAPLRSVDGYSRALSEDCAGQLDANGKKYLERILFSTRIMSDMIDDILKLSRVMRQDAKIETVSLTDLARGVADELRLSDPKREAEFVIADGLSAPGDRGLLKLALQNLLGNAWKYTSKKPRAQIEFGCSPGTDKGGETPVFFIRDNGAGFDMKYAHKLFTPFQRLHPASEFGGSGMGLATVERVIRRHGGRIWAEASVDQGAAFYFTLGRGPS
jgi:signal transduction histidine kinase